MDKKDKMSFLECMKVLIITGVAILAPALIIGGVITLFTPLNIFIGSLIGLLCVIVLIFALGLHKPATANEFVGDEDEDEDDD